MLDYLTYFVLGITFVLYRLNLGLCLRNKKIFKRFILDQLLITNLGIFTLVIKF